VIKNKQQLKTVENSYDASEEPLGIPGVQCFSTVQMSFISSRQQCQGTEGIATTATILLSYNKIIYYMTFELTA